jgi:tetratricopeptide (TPR) repeat protein
MMACLSGSQFLSLLSGDDEHRKHASTCARCRAMLTVLQCAETVENLDELLVELERREYEAATAVAELEKEPAYRWRSVAESDERLHRPEGIRRLLQRAMVGSTTTPRRSLELAQAAVLCCELSPASASVYFDALKELAKYRLSAADDIGGSLAALDAAEALIPETDDPPYCTAILAYARAAVWGDSTCARWALALSYLDTCEDTLKQCDAGRWRGARHLRAAILLRSSDYAGAAALYTELLGETKDPYSRALLSNDLGECYSRMGRPAEALPLLDDALNVFIAHSHILPMARTMWLRGDAIAALGQHEEATRLLDTVSRMFESAGLYDDQLGAELSAVRALHSWDPGANVTSRLESAYQIACALDADQPLRSGSRRAYLWSELRSASDRSALTSDLLSHAAEYLRTIGRGDERPFTRLQ